MWNFAFGAEPEFEKIEQLFIDTIVTVEHRCGSASLRAHLAYTISPDHKTISISSNHHIGSYLAGCVSGMLIQSQYKFELIIKDEHDD